MSLRNNIYITYLRPKSLSQMNCGDQERVARNDFLHPTCRLMRHALTPYKARFYKLYSAKLLTNFFIFTNSLPQHTSFSSPHGTGRPTLKGFRSLIIVQMALCPMDDSGGTREAPRLLNSANPSLFPPKKR